MKPLFQTEVERQLSKYFEETYVLGKFGVRLRGRSKTQTMRNPPMFPPEMWSVADHLNLGLPRSKKNHSSPTKWWKLRLDQEEIKKLRKSQTSFLLSFDGASKHNTGVARAGWLILNLDRKFEIE